MDRDTPVPRRRRTESRHAGEPSSAVAVETTNGKSKTTWLWEAGGRLVETQSVTAEQTSATITEEAEDEEWTDDALPLIASSRPLPHRCPSFPKGRSRQDIAEWHEATRVAYEKAANDPVSNPPILRETKGRETPSSSEVISMRQREMLFRLSSSIVSISSTRVGDDGVPVWEFTGVVIGPSESDEHARILTTSDTVCDFEGKLLNRKLLVRLPNMTIKNGELLFFDRYYGIAVLEISVDMPLRCPSFVSSPDYGDKVFVMARDEDSSLLTTSGRVMCYNETCVDRNYYLYVSCVLPEVSTFGLVIDRDGDIAGLAFFVDWSKTAVLPSSIIRKLVEMERNFSCIARPEHHLCLRAVQFLDMHKREEILYQHNIDSGYIVDEVAINSTAEIIGIRRGDVIVSVNGVCSKTMPELEEYLLSLGWKFLERKNKSSKIVLKLKVYDPIKCQEHTLSLPLGFYCLTAVKERVKVQVTEKTSPGIKRKKTTTVPMPSGRVLRPRKK
ncbi:uncharacterized protein LOC8082545 [Sorghum bicolor]|uniref:PDZ domain-containing protein n=1 Tax=Sorghum bicolor TaxID=4558 RepID=C5Y9N0_SORBI|nr:uncharacterized protein LOC8082545 [Sorghum bicolor]EES13025.2 hypothetical protein SORBI_3006G253000 [Sorghum bicolor]|eukprot:XP_002448699.2 uncharacterized protein LOC8082545 [Sorghum bicolor]